MGGTKVVPPGCSEVIKAAQVSTGVRAGRICTGAAASDANLAAVRHVIQYRHLGTTGWTNSALRSTLWLMVLPLEKVRQLGDFDGLWSLCLRCRCCRHMAEIPARRLIERYGPRKRLSEIAGRLYCRRCQEKYCHCKGRNFEALVGLKR